MDGEISTVTRKEVLGAISNRYHEASKRERSRMFDKFVAERPRTGSVCHGHRRVHLATVVQSRDVLREFFGREVRQRYEHRFLQSVVGLLDALTWP